MSSVSVLSLNLRFGLADDGPNAWEHRKESIVKLFRKHVRRQNICVRMGFPFYHVALENKKHQDRGSAFEVLNSTRDMVESTLEEVWFPGD